MKYLIFSFCLVIASCNWAKQKTKETVNKTGEVVAKTGSEFADGVAKGVEKTFQHEVEVSAPLQQAGLRTGKISVHGTDSTTDNIVSAYFIFDKNFEQEIVARILNTEGQEYGRSRVKIKANQKDATYVDFIFDPRTEIERKGKIVFE
ncbi:MAG: hypothetical protein JNJ58_07325 [Chitinophagaceae bacterium]|nr:hypothetical protein [Chitinophagaceae bacterium]